MILVHVFLIRKFHIPCSVFYTFSSKRWFTVQGLVSTSDGDGLHVLVRKLQYHNRIGIELKEWASPYTGLQQNVSTWLVLGLGDGHLSHKGIILEV